MTTRTTDFVPAEQPSVAPRVSLLKRPMALSTCAFLLGLCTALAAFLRFWRIDHQAYWTDEGYTIERIRGTWSQLLHSLDQQGFPPGWYALLQQWCLTIEHLTHNSVLAFSPVTTRGLTALFGTLTVPAIYYLARFFTDRKGALLVTLLAAVNPFLIYYSRDIKMYAPFWFFVVLNMALFFQMLKARWYWGWLWFPLFTLTGAAMTALHPMAWFMLPIQLIFLLTRTRPRPFDAPVWLLAVAGMCAFPYYWYFQYLPTVGQWLNRVTTDKNMGMGWLSRYTDMSWKTMGGLVTEHLGGYLWPVNPPDQRISEWFELDPDFAQHLATRDSDLMARWELYVGWTLLALLVVGLIPWRRWGQRLGRKIKMPMVAAAAPRFRARWWWVAIWIMIPTGTLALTWLPNKTELNQRILTDERQLQSLDMDIRQLRQTRDQFPKDGAAWTSANRRLDARESARKKIDDDIASNREAMKNTWSEWVWHGFNPKPIWEPRYLGIIVPALLMWLGAALLRLPTWPVRGAAILFVVGISVFSALSNHLIFRNAPINQVARIVAQYTDPKNVEATAVATPESPYAQPANDAEYALARGLRPVTPTTSEQRRHMGDAVFNELYNPESVVNWLRETADNRNVKTIVLTDRYGDLDSGSLTTAALQAILGNNWKLVHEESYQWHYEWRFYIYSTWRTRVWQRGDL